MKKEPLPAARLLGSARARPGGRPSKKKCTCKNGRCKECRARRKKRKAFLDWWKKNRAASKARPTKAEVSAAARKINKMRKAHKGGRKLAECAICGLDRSCPACKYREYRRKYMRMWRKTNG